MNRRDFLGRIAILGGLAAVQPWKLLDLLGARSFEEARHQLSQWDLDVSATALTLNNQISAGSLLCDSAIASLVVHTRNSGDATCTLTDNTDPTFIRPSSAAKSLKLAMAPDGTLTTVYYLEWTISQALQGVSRFNLAYYFAPATGTDTTGWGMTMYVGDPSSLTNNYQWGPLTVAPNAARAGWNTVTLDRATTTTTGGSPTLQMTMTRIRLRIQTLAGTGGTIYFCPIYINKHHRPKVVFSFDDQVWPTQYTKGYQYMLARHAAGSQAVETSIVDGGAGVTLAQLYEMQSHGWSFHNHTVTHPHLSQISLDAAMSEVSQAQSWLLSKGLTYGNQTIIYPYGDTSAQLEAALQSLGFKYGAIVRSQVERHWDGIEQPMHINRQDTSVATSLATLKTRIDDAVKYGGYIVFLTHDIEDSASGAQTSTATFQGLVDYAVRLRDSNMLDIVTLQDLVDGMGAVRRRRI